MISETATAVPPEISDSIGKLNAETEKLQRELAQALDVWQTTLASEKERFDELLRHKELAWREQEEQWSRQSQAYEERLELLKSDFEARLKQGEQGAAHALAELDDAWQRDKLEWGTSGKDPGPQRLELEEKVKRLELELAEKERLRIEDRQQYDAQHRDTEIRAADQTPSTIALEGQLKQFQETVTLLQDRASRSDELVNACLQALDYQISVLYDLVHHYALPAAGGDSSAQDLAQP